jgi:hypothetical protein
MKTGNIVGLSCVFVCVLQGFCFAQGCPHYPLCAGVHTYSPADPITVSIVKQCDQNWHPVGRMSKFHAVVEDWDSYTCSSCNPCVTLGWWTDVLYCAWDGEYLLSPRTGTTVTWRPTAYTATATPIWLHVTDQAYIRTCGCDAGSRDDDDWPVNGRDGIFYMGAWEAGASMVVSGTNKPTPETKTVWASEYYDFVTRQLTGAPQKVASASLASASHIVLGNKDDDTVISPNPQEAHLAPITSQAVWTMFCRPEDKWIADMNGTVNCYVNRMVDGHIRSEVWDNDSDVPDGSVDVGVAFGSPIAITISRTFNYGGSRSRGQVAVGFGYQSDNLSFNGYGYQGSVEHEDDSNLHSYPGGLPSPLTTHIDIPWSGSCWTADKSSSGVKTATLRTMTEGWIKGKEDSWWVPNWYVYADMYVEAWTDGTITYGVASPYYVGYPHENPAWNPNW